MPTVNHKSLETVTQSIFISHGCTSDAASQVAKSLVLANLCGHDSHGVVRIAPYLTNIKRGVLQPTAELAVLHETESLVVADAQHGFGQVQMPAIIERLATKANSQGISCRSEEHTSERQSQAYLVCRLLPEKKNKKNRKSNKL